MLPEITVDLDAPPAERWRELTPYLEQARELLQAYAGSLGDPAALLPLVGTHGEQWFEADHREEIAALARLAGTSPDAVLLANLTYDATKYLWGCTAFAVDTESGPLHARNLDWWTENGLLSRYTQVANYMRGGRCLYRVVGWPGFAGALSGVAPGRFSVTLNAVSSPDPPALAQPVTFLLRTVLESAADFDDGVERLARTPIMCDCLLLVTGTRPGEMVVIERTPTRHALRFARDGFLVVTNDYRKLDAPEESEGMDVLLQTACGRFDRATALLMQHRPQSAEECFAILRDPQIQMSITVQQMVFSPAEGTVTARVPF